MNAQKERDPRTSPAKLRGIPLMWKVKVFAFRDQNGTGSQMEPAFLTRFECSNTGLVAVFVVCYCNYCFFAKQTEIITDTLSNRCLVALSHCVVIGGFKMTLLPTG